MINLWVMMMKIEGGFSTKIKEDKDKLIGMIFKPVGKSVKKKIAKKEEPKEVISVKEKIVEKEKPKEVIKTIKATEVIEKASKTATKKRSRSKKTDW